MGSSKSLSVAYLCWLFGGLFGLHHFYLGRDKHAFITFATFGGYFTLGLFRDLWRLPEYVKDANNDLKYVNWLHDEIKRHERPPSSLVRQSGLMIMGNILSYLVQYAIPKEILPNHLVSLLEILLIPLASALGVWLVGNVGRHQGCFKVPMVAAYAVALPSLLFSFQISSFSTLAAMIAFNRYAKVWRVQPERPQNTYRRILILTLCAVVYLTLWSSWLYFNCTIEDPETAEPIKCRDALENFFNSPAFTNLSEAVWILVEHVRHQGFSGLWREMMQEFDVSGKTSALSVLGLSEDATSKEILAQYKKLSRLYHPDKERDPSKKAEKQEKFIQVQEAYRKLEPSVHKRRSHSYESETSPTREEL